jgi:hypothetical protein
MNDRPGLGVAGAPGDVESVVGALAAFISRWYISGSPERANKDHFFTELLHVVVAPRPDPAPRYADQGLQVVEREATFGAGRAGARTTTRTAASSWRTRSTGRQGREEPVIAAARVVRGPCPVS